MKRNVIISGDFTISELTAPKPSNASKPKTAADRIAALKAAGIDTSCFFPMGSDMVVKVVDGVPVQVLDDDPIYQGIASGGYVNVHPLFRRFVMAQMFRLLRRMERTGESFNALVQYNGYEYQWRMLENELHAIAKMQENNDTACFSQRVLWFNKDVVSAMIDDYLPKLRSRVDKLTYRRNKRGEMVYKHTCKGMPYVKIAGKNIFLDDLGSKIYAPVIKASLAVKQRPTGSFISSSSASTSSVRISNGGLSRPMRSSTPTRARVPISPCATSSCSMAHASRQRTKRRHCCISKKRLMPTRKRAGA